MGITFDGIQFILLDFFQLAEFCIRPASHFLRNQFGMTPAPQTEAFGFEITLTPFITLLNLFIANFTMSSGIMLLNF